MIFSSSNKIVSTVINKLCEDSKSKVSAIFWDKIV